MDPSKSSHATYEYTSSGFFVLRTPLLPIEDFLKLSQPAADAPRTQPTAGDRGSARAQLRQWVQRPEVREALWIASPELLGSLSLWWDGPESAKGQKLEQALYRYLARMTARATPFGAFAACTLGKIGNHTRLELSPRSQYRRRTRLDMEYLCNLAETISADTVMRRNVRFRRNSSLHLAAGKYHHLCGDWHDGARLYRLVATEPTPVLDATLLRAASGARAHTLASALVEADPEIALEEAEEYVARLIESQLLVSELAPPVTGAEPVEHMVGQLEQGETQVVADVLRSIAGNLRELDQDGLGADLRAYDRIVNATSQLGCEFKPGRLIQLDVVKPAATACLDERLVNDILRAIATLHSIQGDSGQPVFQQFKDDFQERYGAREVPLLEALDDEAGIGFENQDNPAAEPLIAGIDFRPAEETLSGEGRGAGPVLARRLEELRARKEIVLELDSELLEELKAGDPPPLPDSFCAMGVCFSGSEGKQGFYLQSVSGPSGANLLARFCHADERLGKCVQDHLRAEEALHPDGAVFAEIAHLPQGRVGNVVSRPILRQYEIPFLATSGVPPDRQIPLADLTVSLRDGRVVLRSRRLGCEVLPRLTAAHNFNGSGNLKLYKFLCLLQQQGVSADLSWNWGALEQADFLPRVALDNIVFSPARWRLTEEAALELSPGPARVREWQETNQVPRFACIVERDNQLLIDFENVLGVATFLEHVRKRRETLLVEMFPAPDALPVRGPEGSFVHEIVVPMIRRSRRPSTQRAGKTAAPWQPARSVPAVPATDFPAPSVMTGSDWLFAKLYCSPSHADRLLLELVGPLVEEVESAGTTSGWFFTRYADPRWHLRLRFRGDPAALQAHVFSALSRMAEQQKRQGTLWRLEFDTYEREVERYGGPAGIAIAERLFHLDSELCLDLLRLTSGDAGAQLRWQLAFCGVDRLLTGLGFSAAEKKMLAENMRDSREQDWVVDQTYRRQLARKFRSDDLRQTLAAILHEAAAGAGSASMLPAESVSAFARFSTSLQRIGKQLEDRRRVSELGRSIPELAVSFIHMHLNRMLRSAHHEQETVLYDLLARIYASGLASEKRLTT